MPTAIYRKILLCMEAAVHRRWQSQALGLKKEHERDKLYKKPLILLARSFLWHHVAVGNHMKPFFENLALTVPFLLPDWKQKAAGQFKVHKKHVIISENTACQLYSVTFLSNSESLRMKSSGEWVWDKTRALWSLLLKPSQPDVWGPLVLFSCSSVYFPPWYSLPPCSLQIVGISVISVMPSGVFFVGSGSLP